MTPIEKTAAYRRALKLESKSDRAFVRRKTGNDKDYVKAVDASEALSRHLNVHPELKETERFRYSYQDAEE